MKSCAAQKNHGIDKGTKLGIEQKGIRKNMQKPK